MAAIHIDQPAEAGARHRERHPDFAGQAAAERDPDLAAAIDEASAIRRTRDRFHSDVPVPDRMSGLLTGGSFILALALWWLLLPPAAVPLGVLAACVAVHAVAASIEFEIGPGSAVPTTPVLFVSLFLLPPALVPVVPLLGLMGAALIARIRDPERHERVSVLAGSAWHSMGPAAVFALAGAPAATLGAWPVCVAALAAQFACDTIASWVRNVYGLGVPSAKLFGALRFTFLADLTLAPVGVAAALAAPASPVSLLFLVGPFGLLALLHLDRTHQIDRAVVLSEAFTQSADRARRDVLTGLKNRLAWEEEVARISEVAGPIGVVLADVDGLKATNDAYGHEAGDRLLVTIAQAIQRATPAEGGAMAARLGGDEFGILLPGALATRTAWIAQSLREAFDSASDSSGITRPSASVGCGIARSGAMLPFAFMEADRGVYEHKAQRSVSRR